jgi:Uma2 family endonuclease
MPEDGHQFEVIEGGSWERPPRGAEANRVATVLASLLDVYADAQKRGLVFSARCGYQIFSNDPKKVRKPDVSFIARGRLPNDRPPRGHVLIAPDLIVEVVSPNDLAEDVDTRAADFLQAGVTLLWIIFPATRSVLVLRSDGSAQRLTQLEELQGEQVLSGFHCRVETLFADL